VAEHLREERARTVAHTDTEVKMKTKLKSSIKGIAVCVGVLCSHANTRAQTSDTPIVPVPAGVLLRTATIRVIVAPDHRDWTYKLGESVRFTVAVTADSEPVEGATVSYTIGPDMYPGPVKTIALPINGITIDGGTMPKPGFLRCVVTTHVAGHRYRGLATAAFSPEKIEPTQVEPSDFDAFWSEGKAQLAKIPIDGRMALVPDACTSAVDVYQVSFRTFGNENSRIYGILCEPKAPGRCPAVLELPGAGVRHYSGDLILAAKGAVVLQIGIHGIPVNLNNEVYDRLIGGALDNYWLSNLDSRDHFYFHRVYLSCVRANDFLTSLPNWDGNRLVVMGGSQGGQLTIVTAAIDPRVTALVSSFPGFCDVTGDLHGRAGGWPRPFHPDEAGAPSILATPAKIATSAYYDTVNFARRIRVPGHYSLGYNDEVCPPTAFYAAYNIITAPKTIGLSIEAGHAPPPEQVDMINSKAADFLGLK
jgi:cephalosporin-C deacetylase-like acetyl esterase